MTPSSKKSFNTAIGTLFFGVGAVAWGLALYFSVVPAPAKPAPVSLAARTDVASCESALRSFGFGTVKGERALEVFEPVQDDVRKQLEKASLAIALCRLDLASFCIGPGCEKPSLLSFSLATDGAIGQAEARTPASSEPVKGSLAVPSKR